MTHDWLRQDLIFTQSGVRSPGRYCESARLPTIPSTPDVRATSKSAIAVALDVLREEDVRRVDDGLAQRFLANAQLGGEQVPALELHEVERDERHRVLGGDAPRVGLPPDVDALLQTLEGRAAVGVEHDELAVDDRLTCTDARPDRLRLRVARRSRHRRAGR